MWLSNDGEQPQPAFSALKQDYYGKTLKSTKDLQSNACVTPTRPVPAFVRQALMKVHPEVTARSLGCWHALLYLHCMSQWSADIHSGCPSPSDTMGVVW